MSDAFQEAVSGAVGAVASTLCTYPLDVAKTRLQAQRRAVKRDGSPRRENSLKDESWETPRRSISGPLPYQGTTDCLQRIVKEEGMLELFAGLQSSCVKTALTNFVYFYLLRAVRPLLGRYPMLQGMGAGVGVQLIILPIDMVVTRLQSVRDASLKGNFFKMVSDIVQKQGFLGLWSGIGPGLCLTLNPGITQMVLMRLRSKTGKESAARAFWSAAVAKAVAGTTTYPYMRAKVQMQVQGMVAHDGARQSMAKILMSIVRESGAFALFDGLAPQLANGVLKEAILNMVRVQIFTFVKVLFDSLNRAVK